MDVKELVSKMNNDVERIVEYLLPKGKKIGNEWCVGGIDNVRGKSLKIKLSGEKVGIWADFASLSWGSKGDILGLWKEVRRIDVIAAIKEVKEFLHIKDVKYYNQTPKKYTRPVEPKLIKNEGAEKYLVNERKLSEYTLKTYSIGYDKFNIIFPYFKNDILVNNKYFSRDKEGKKQFRTESGAESCLFGWHAIDNDIRSIVICEGEIDAMSMFEFGYQALSIPYGAGGNKKNDWIENDYELLERFDDIYICMDMDQAGEIMAKDIMERLGLHRCKILKLPCNDVNECLTKGFGMDKIIDDAEYNIPAKLKDISDFTDEIINLIYPKEIQYYSPNFHSGFKNIRFGFGELTVLSGFSGSGKTTFSVQVCLDCIAQNNKICIASLEQKPEKYLLKMVKQAALGNINKDKVISVVNWLTKDVLIYDHVGNCDLEEILEVFVYAFKRYGVRFFIIDSLMKLNIDEDDWNKQKDLVNKLAGFTQKYNIHIILITHVRKKSNSNVDVDKQDVKGTGAITDIADNVILFKRRDIKDKNKYDMKLSCVKQREFGWEGVIYFNFIPEHECFYEPDKQPINYLSEPNFDN